MDTGWVGGEVRRERSLTKRKVRNHEWMGGRVVEEGKGKEGKKPWT